MINGVISQITSFLRVQGPGNAVPLLSGAAHQLAGQQDQFNTLAILAITSGSLTMIFFVLCVEQLTNFSREVHASYTPVRSVGARFYGCKYLFALLVLGVSSSALIADGVVAFMRLGALTPTWLNMSIATGTAIFEFACWSFVLVVIIIGFLEFRLRPYFMITRSPRKRSEETKINLDSKRFSRLKSDMRIVAVWARVLTALAVVACIVLRAIGSMSDTEFFLLLPAFAAAVLVVNAMFYSGLMALFFLQRAAFVVITDISIFQAAEHSKRLYVLSKQLEDPHRNMWIFPGGLMARGQAKDPVSYIRKKLELARVDAAVLESPFYHYRHLMPEEEVAYRGAFYRAVPRGNSLNGVPRTTTGRNVFCALTFDEMTSDLVPDLIRSFVAEWEKLSAEEWAIQHEGDPEPS